MLAGLESDRLDCFHFKEYPVAVSPLVGGQKAVNCVRASFLSHQCHSQTQNPPQQMPLRGLPFDTSTLRIRFQHERAE